MTQGYRNSNRRAWSIREAGSVVGYVDACAMRYVSFYTSEVAR